MVKAMVEDGRVAVSGDRRSGPKGHVRYDPVQYDSRLATCDEDLLPMARRMWLSGWASSGGSGGQWGGGIQVHGYGARKLTRRAARTAFSGRTFGP